MGADDYFPFGLTMPGRSNSTANANDLYKYTSHERDDEAVSDALDYMLARNYDPTVGRMNQIDPMAHVYAGVSPFAYALNTPMNAIDPDGRLVIFINGQHGGNAYYGYWDPRIVQASMDSFNDYHTKFKDGANGGWLNTLSFGILQQGSNLFGSGRWNVLSGNRYMNGYDQGEKDANALRDYARRNNLSHSVLSYIIDMEMFQAGSLLGRVSDPSITVHMVNKGSFGDGDNAWLANNDVEGGVSLNAEGTGHSTESMAEFFREFLQELVNLGMLEYDEKNKKWVFTPSKSDSSDDS